MRVAVLSDIHGNLLALEAVLSHIAGQQVGATVCLGDLAFWGPAPSECISLIRDLGIPCVHGNADAFLLLGAGMSPARPLPAGYALPEQVVRYLPWHLARVSRPDLAYLSDWRASYAIVDAESGQFSLHRVEYDVDAAVRLAAEREFFIPPDAYGRALRQGTAPAP